MVSRSWTNNYNKKFKDKTDKLRKLKEILLEYMMKVIRGQILQDNNKELIMKNNYYQKTIKYNKY